MTAVDTVGEPASHPGTVRTAVAELLVRLRRSAGLSQAQLARRSGLSERALRDLERGVTSRPRHWSLHAIADALLLSDVERITLLTAARPGAPTPAAPPPPAQLDRMLGRDAELATLLDLASGRVHRLVTLSGPGGVGKSRLLAEAAVVLARNGLDIRRVDLSGVTEPALVGEMIAEAMGVGGGSRLDPVTRIAAAIRDRRSMLLLDGFERLLDAAATIQGLLTRCTGLTIVVTSRIPLRIRGEREVRLAGLPVPGPDGHPADSAALTLLVDRTAQVRPGFRLDAANRADLAMICRTVEGLPLAIELAAARLRVLAPAELVTRLHRQLDVLADGLRGTQERHRSLRATIEYSLTVVPDGARTLFGWLSLFPSGVCLADLEPVVTGLGRDQSWLLAGLAELLDASLLRARYAPEQTRYRLPDPMRDLARELLDGHERWAVGQHMAHRYLQRIREAADVADEGCRLLDADVDNVRAALRWTLRHEPASVDERTVDALFRYWDSRGRCAEGQTLLVAAADAGVPAAGLALLRAGTMSSMLDDAQQPD
ncbi:ATP-binding protein [Actinoplanes sp. NPDC049265]|uniref:ATP-binding protein n=1 Tax=Actinoplanes sp. NPDC049265 TaxID=3363902 RepID=UPI003718FC02